MTCWVVLAGRTPFWGTPLLCKTWQWAMSECLIFKGSKPMEYTKFNHNSQTSNKLQASIEFDNIVHRSQMFQTAVIYQEQKYPAKTARWLEVEFQNYTREHKRKWIRYAKWKGQRQEKRSVFLTGGKCPYCAWDANPKGAIELTKTDKRSCLFSQITLWFLRSCCCWLMMMFCCGCCACCFVCQTHIVGIAEI